MYFYVNVFLICIFVFSAVRSFSILPTNFLLLRCVCSPGWLFTFFYLNVLVNRWCVCYLEDDLFFLMQFSIVLIQGIHMYVYGHLLRRVSIHDSL